MVDEGGENLWYGPVKQTSKKGRFSCVTNAIARSLDLQLDIETLVHDIGIVSISH
jgi:hypothetical protein